ncbi:MAG: helix-hairpin-helix domain-containing protein [Candidatus Hodarchaeota archaeon]
MVLNLQEVGGIEKATMEKMRAMGIDSVEKLASIKLENLLKISGIDKSTAIKYITNANKLLEEIKDDVISKGEEPISKKGIFEDITPIQEPKFRIPKGKEPIDNKAVFKDITSTQEPKFRILKVKQPNDNKAVFEKKVSSKGEMPLDKKVRSQLIKKYLRNMQEPKFRTPKVKESHDTKIVIEKKVFRKGKEPIDKKVIIKRKAPSKYKKIPEQYSPSKAKPIREEIPSKKKPKKKKIQDTFFPQEIMQKIRFLHFKIKHLEEFLLKEHEDIELEELNYVWDYIKLLNVNYKIQSQIKIFKELDLTTTFYDPIENKYINIWDIMFECTRVLWVLARVYAQLSEKYELENNLKNATISMVECSKAYKTAAHFSAACTRQEDKGLSLSFDNLELNSEEARIFAQSLAATREENKKNFFLASKMYAGLSALSKRLSYLKENDSIRNYQLRAQSNYDLGKAYNLKATAILKDSDLNENGENIKRLRQKANYLFSKAEGLWEFIRDNFNELSKRELNNIRINLSIVNEDIIENDVEIPDFDKIKDIEEIEPFIAVPENVAPIVPRTTMYLTSYGPRNLEFNTFKEFKKKKLETNFRLSKIEKLQNKKAGIGRVIKELKILNENNDIDINTFIELLEKYSIELKMVESAIDKLKNPDEKAKTVNSQFNNITVKK